MAPAREIIDWSIKGKSIFDRKKPLAPKTLARIYAGAVKFQWPEPFLVILRNHMAGQSVDDPLPTIAAGGTHIGLAQPVILANRTNNIARDPDQLPLPCLTTSTGGGIAVVEPIIVNGRKGSKALGVSADPVPTLDTKGGVWLAEPFVLSQQNSGQPRSSDDPLPTITTGGAGVERRPGCARPMLVEPFILNRHGDNGTTRAHPVDQPTPTTDCRGAGYLIEPFMLSRQGEGAARSTDDPTPTQTAKHSHVLISPYYGSGSGETCQSVEDPLPTVTAKGRFGMVVPVTNGSGWPGPRDVADPVPTMTTAKGGEFAFVLPVTHAGGPERVLDANSDPLPTVTGANRGELAFIAAQFGEREGQSPRIHDVDDPAPTICATGHINLIEATPQYDILFRMLEPHELSAAMGFTSEEASYEFAGTKTEKIKQIGNAVSVATMRACVSAIMADAVPKRRGENAADTTSVERLRSGAA